MIIEKKFIDLFAKTTQRGAYGASTFKGKNNKNAADKAAVDEMRKELNCIDMKGKIKTVENANKELWKKILMGDKSDNIPCCLINQNKEWAKPMKKGLLLTRLVWQ